MINEARTPQEKMALELPTPSPYAVPISTDPITPSVMEGMTPSPPAQRVQTRSAEQRRVQLSVKKEALSTWQEKENYLVANDSHYGTPLAASSQQKSLSQVSPINAEQATPTSHPAKRTPLQSLSNNPTALSTPSPLGAGFTPMSAKRQPVQRYHVSRGQTKADLLLQKVADDIVDGLVDGKALDSQYMLNPLEAIGMGDNAFAARPKLANSP